LAKPANRRDFLPFCARNQGKKVDCLALAGRSTNSYRSTVSGGGKGPACKVNDALIVARLSDDCTAGTESSFWLQSSVMAVYVLSHCFVKMLSNGFPNTFIQAEFFPQFFVFSPHLFL
jgi:hypothetical protein